MKQLLNTLFVTSEDAYLSLENDFQTTCSATLKQS